MSARTLIILFVMLLAVASVSAQDHLEGRVTYITSQHVYVRFNSTEGLNTGDTLLRSESRGEIPALVILNLSSTSCVCEPLGNLNFRISDRIIGKPRVPDSGNLPTSGETEAVAIAGGEPVLEEAGNPEESAETAHSRQARKQEIGGRLSVASYSYLKNAQSEGRQRLRYTVSMSAQNLAGSGLTVESYLTFSHTLNQSDEIRENVFNGLKIYNLSASYAFNGSTIFAAGRRINPNLSSVGAIDGLQFETGFGAFSVGAFAGLRPDYRDYSFNTGLFQYGAYLSHAYKGASGKMQNTLAYIEQRNQGATDRRFVYFQHQNNLISNLWFFGSVEVDLYQQVDGAKQTVFNLYNTYLNLRYRIVRPLTVSLSYSARNNLIYYETYKDFLERLLDEKTLQGWRFRVNYRPIPYLYIGAHGVYRYRKDDPMPTKNAHGYVTYSRIPGIAVSVNASVTWMQSAYLDGMIYGMGLGREFLDGRLHVEFKYHYVDHAYRNGEMTIAQHVGEAGLTWSIYRKLALSVFYEGTFEESITYHRIFAGLSQRF